MLLRFPLCLLVALLGNTQAEPTLTCLATGQTSSLSETLKHLLSQQALGCLADPRTAPLACCRGQL